MNTKLKIGDFGKASFKYDKKGFKGGLIAYGTIKDMDGKYLIFEDNDGYIYLVQKNKFEFEKGTDKK
jgi:hypothetical protein